MNVELFETRMEEKKKNRKVESSSSNIRNDFGIPNNGYEMEKYILLLGYYLIGIKRQFDKKVSITKNNNGETQVTADIAAGKILFIIIDIHFALFMFLLIHIFY